MKEISLFFYFLYLSLRKIKKKIEININVLNVNIPIHVYELIKSYVNIKIYFEVDINLFLKFFNLLNTNKLKVFFQCFHFLKTENIKSKEKYFLKFKNLEMKTVFRK